MNKTHEKYLFLYFSNDLDIIDMKITSADLLCLIEKKFLSMKLLFSFYNNV
jgi:hypothetical protein